MITLDDATYAYYAVSQPRPYTLIVYMTAANPKYKCSVCKLIDREFSLLAQSYVLGVRNVKGTQNMFFVRLDYEQAPRTFQSYQIMSVPLIFHINPHQGDREGEKDYDIHQRDKLQIPQEPDAEFIGNFIRERTGVSIAIIRSMIVVYIVLIIFFIIIGLLVKPVINSLPFWLSIIRMKVLWISVSAGVYTCAISGLIFDIIRSPPM